MSLTPMNEDSAWLTEENPVGKNSWVVLLHIMWILHFKRVETSRYVSMLFLSYFLLIFETRCYSPDIDPFWFSSTFNPDCSFCINWYNCPLFTVILTFCFAEDTIFPYKYFITNFAIIIYIFLSVLYCSPLGNITAYWSSVNFGAAHLKSSICFCSYLLTACRYHLH